MNLSKLSIKELMELRIEVNNEIEDITNMARKSLLAGDFVPNFAFKQGRTSRYVKNTKAYEALLFEELGGAAYSKTLISLTNAEKLIKKEFDPSDSAELIYKLSLTLDTKTSDPTLIYTGETND